VRAARCLFDGLKRRAPFAQLGAIWDGRTGLNRLAVGDAPLLAHPKFGSAASSFGAF